LFKIFVSTRGPLQGLRLCGPPAIPVLGGKHGSEFLNNSFHYVYNIRKYLFTTRPSIPGIV